MAINNIPTSGGLTSVVSVALLCASEEDEVTSSNLHFLEFVDIIYHFFIILGLNIHFETIFLLLYASIEQLFSYLLTFS